MTTFTVSLPDPLGDFVNEQVAQGGFSSASDYISNIVQQAQANADEARELKQRLENLSPAAQTRLDDMLQAGLDSGAGIPADESFWQTLIEEHERDHSARVAR